MKKEFSVSLSKIIKDFSLEKIYCPCPPEEILIYSNEINKPGIQFSGDYEFYDPARIQVIGKSEDSFLYNHSPEECKNIINTFFEHKPPVVIITRDLPVSEMMIEAAKKYQIPILRTSDGTSSFMSALIAFLNVKLAPRVVRHGVLVEVYGEGVLILGDSGIGKSETAIELVKRGHRLIADDAVEIRKVSSKSLVGSAPENIRHFIELRGIGIVNVRRIFGIGAVKLTEKIDMIVNLEAWDANKVYDRMGLESEKTNILGLDIVSVSIPVKPGRNLAVVIEVAAMNNRQKKMGYNAAAELLEKLGMNDAGPETGKSEVEPF